jgi:hypothetical protein
VIQRLGHPAEPFVFQELHNRRALRLQVLECGDEFFEYLLGNLGVQVQSPRELTLDTENPASVLYAVHAFDFEQVAQRGNYRRRTSVAESLGGAGFGLGGLFFAVLGRRGGFERPEQMGRDASHFLDRCQERSLVRLGRLGETADLSHELQRRRPNFIVRNRRIKIEKCLDVSAHFGLLLF